MAVPLCRLEGTWQEIAARVPDFDTRKLEVLVYDAEATPVTSKASDDPRMAIINEIAEEVKQMNLTPDTKNYLREGRAAGMFRDDSAE